MAGGWEGEETCRSVTTTADADLTGGLTVGLFATSRQPEPEDLIVSDGTVRYRVVAPAAGPRYTAHAGH